VIKNEAPTNNQGAVISNREALEASGRSEATAQPKDIWAVRIHLKNARKAVRDLAMFKPAIDSKLRGRQRG
jgi:hypothetical protein